MSRPNPAATRATDDRARSDRSALASLITRSRSVCRVGTWLLIERARPGPAPAHVRSLYQLLYAGYNRRDWELATCAMHPRQYSFRGLGRLQRTFPDMPETLHGPDGFMQAQLLFAEAFDPITVDLGVIEIEKPRLIRVESTFNGVGRTSGVPFVQPTREWHRFEKGFLVEQTYEWV